MKECQYREDKDRKRREDNAGIRQACFGETSCMNEREMLVINVSGMMQHDEATRERIVQAEFLGFVMRIERLVLLQRLLAGTNYSTGIVLQHT